MIFVYKYPWAAMENSEMSQFCHKMLYTLWGVLVFCSTVAGAQSFDTKAKAAYVFDMTTQSVLFEKRADDSLPPASMSKLMTLLMAFEALRDGRLLLNEKLRVSEHAMSYGGSTMFLDTTDRVSVEDLLRGIIVLSGNDACVVIAEALSFDGTEAGFAQMMTARAKELGMTQSTFVNSNGWPQAGHLMSAKDLGILAQYLIEEFPEYYPFFAETEFAFDGRAPSNTQNRNPLLKLGIGADGLKTGHTSQSGYSLVGSAQRAGRRVIFVVTGLNTAQARAEEAKRIITWAFRQFTPKTLAKAGQVIAHADVWMGAQAQVALAPQVPATVLLPSTGNADVATYVEYLRPLPAPIMQGDVVANLVVSVPNLPERRLPLVAADDVPRGGIWVKMQSTVLLLKNYFLSS